MQTRVVNIRHEPYDQYIGRAGKGEDGYFGNPFKLGRGCSRGSTIDRYRAYFYNRMGEDGVFVRRIHALRGLTLGCFCAPHACHGDVIAEYLDNIPEITVTDGEGNPLTPIS